MLLKLEPICDIAPACSPSEHIDNPRQCQTGIKCTFYLASTCAEKSDDMVTIFKLEICGDSASWQWRKCNIWPMTPEVSDDLDDPAIELPECPAMILTSISIAQESVKTHVL